MHRGERAPPLEFAGPLHPTPCVVEWQSARASLLFLLPARPTRRDERNCRFLASRKKRTCLTFPYTPGKGGEARKSPLNPSHVLSQQPGLGTEGLRLAKGSLAERALRLRTDAALTSPKARAPCASAIGFQQKISARFLLFSKTPHHREAKARG